MNIRGFGVYGLMNQIAMAGELSRGAALLMMAWLSVHAATGEDSAKWESVEREGRTEVRRGNSVMFSWQGTPLATPTGGGKFAGSAFMHPLRTPSGFEWTTSQPADHLHHFGLWWPWKFIQVDGETYNCWEIQDGQGAHVARTSKALPAGPGKFEWEFLNETVIKKPGAEPRPAIRETAHVSVVPIDKGQMLDISLRQQAVKSPVTIVNYRYSGFSWRGPQSWNKDNSTLLASEGQGRDHANGTPARWVVVSGPAPQGPVSVLLMSAAINVAKTQERLRVWDSKNLNGAPFVNFNPVMEKALPLDDAHPAVAVRKYRVIAADRLIDAAAAEAEWRKWLGK